MVSLEGSGDHHASDRRPGMGVISDRDGTLIELVPYLRDVEQLRWIPGVPQSIRLLNDRNIPVIVITNQAGVARGYFTEDDVRSLHTFMQESLLRLASARIDEFYYCPYHPEGSVPSYTRTSDDRKPGTGMFERAVAEWKLDVGASFAVGDRNHDLEPARRLGMSTILVRTGYGDQEREKTVADQVVPDFNAAVASIIHQLP